jgi:CRISPR-associated protein Csd1
MLLQRLREYADQRMALPPRLYAEVPVRYIIELDISGRPRNPHPTDTADPANPRTRSGERRLAPQVQRTAATRPLLLADNAEYTFGMIRANDDTDREKRMRRAQERHRAYLEVLSRCATAVQEPAVAAVQQFLHNNPLSQLTLPDDFDPGATITFRVWEGTHAVFPIDLDPVKAFWAAEHDPAAQGAHMMQCLVCGRRRPVLARLQSKIKGVPGGQPSGTAIISANSDAFESYGLEASLIAPTCADCGERFTKAANDLITNRESSIRIGPAAVLIFWTRKPIAFSLRSLLDDPQPEDVRALLASPFTGRFDPAFDSTPFYATVFSGSGGRTVVRDWIDTTLEQVRDQLTRWFRMQTIVGPRGEDPRWFGLVDLADATVRVRNDIPPPTPRALLSAALTGAPLPWSLLVQALGRARAERRVTHARAALIKLVISSQSQLSGQEDGMAQLDLDDPNPAYRCGRLLAVLEQIQRQAIPGIKATIVDRFFGTASSAPASVFGRLVRGAQPHLAKLERDRRGAYIVLQQRLEEILSGLPDFPRVLTLEEQGLFALGYYHQRAYDRKRAQEARARRQTDQAAAPEADLLIDDTDTTNTTEA